MLRWKSVPLLLSLALALASFSGGVPLAESSLPDLVANITGPSTGKAGEPMASEVSVTVKNLGNEAAPGTISPAGRVNVDGYLVELVLSSDRSVAVRPATFSAGFMEDMLLKGGRVSRTYDVASGASLMVWDPATAQEDDLQIPNDTPSGNYFICAVVDPSGTVDEEDESNNVHCAPLNIQGEPSQPSAPDETPTSSPEPSTAPTPNPEPSTAPTPNPEPKPGAEEPQTRSSAHRPRPRTLSRLQRPQRPRPRTLSQLQRPQRHLPRPLSQLPNRPLPQVPNRHLSPHLRPHPYVYPSSQTPLPS